MKQKALTPKKETSQSLRLLCFQSFKGFKHRANAWSNCTNKGFFCSGPNLDRKKLKNTSLSIQELAIILGGLLGNGSLKLYPGYKNARYSFRHSIVQKNYFFFKVNCLKNLSSFGSIQVQKPDGWSTNQKLRFSSRALPCLTEIHSITHHSNNLKIQRRWLNHLTAESLAIWWFDDGSIVGGGRQGCLCTDNFTLKENQILVQYLKKVWNIEGRIHPVKNSVKQKTVSQGGKSPKGLDPKGLDPKGLDPKGLDPKGLDPKSLDPKGLDPKGLDPKGFDPKSLGPKGHGLSKELASLNPLGLKVDFNLFSQVSKKTFFYLKSLGVYRMSNLAPEGKATASALIVARENKNKVLGSTVFFKNSYRLYFSTLELKKFLTIIIPYVPHNDMLYKCTLKYKSEKLQERWISHMISLLPEKFHNQLRK